MFSIYLTFDDGPQNPGTQNCLDILSLFSIPATFFVIGSHFNVLDREHYFKKYIINGHLLANHSRTHAKGIGYTQYFTIPGYAANDIVEFQQQYQFETKVIRLPGNSAWVNSLEIKCRKQVSQTCLDLKKQEFIVVGWDIEWVCVDNNGTTPLISAEDLFSQIKEKLRCGNTKCPNHIVLLMHDRMFITSYMIHELRRLISQLITLNRVTFKRMDEHPFIKI